MIMIILCFCVYIYIIFLDNIYIYREREFSWVNYIIIIVYLSKHVLYTYSETPSWGI